MISPGAVVLVGAGPGDPELLTIKAMRALQFADVVVHDRLVHPDILAHARPHARLIFVGKAGGDDASTSQDDINAELIRQARLGRRVVRLKGGDPFVFGRGAEEALALTAAGVPWSVVPGVSAGVAVPANAQIPVTHRGVARAVVFATATSKDGLVDVSSYATVDTVVMFMAGQRLDAVMRALQAAGRSASTPCAVVAAGTWEHERVVTGTVGSIVADLVDITLPSPTLVIVGEVVSLRAQLQQILPAAEAFAVGARS